MFYRSQQCILLWSPELYALGLPHIRGFPGSSAGKESACNAGDHGLIPGSGRSPGEGIGYPFQYSWASLVAQTVKNLLAMWENWVWSLCWEWTTWDPSVVIGLPIVGMLIGRAGSWSGWLPLSASYGGCQPTGRWGWVLVQLSTCLRVSRAGANQLVAEARFANR